MKIGIANDHRGLKMKQILTKYLINKGYDVINYGTDTEDRTDYTKYGFILGEKVSKNEVDYGIAICGSAIGISIACNKVKGVRCGKVNTVKEAIHAKENDFINIIALSGEEDENINKQIIDAFLESKENEVDPIYKKRVLQIKNYEETNEY
ncbi:MAG: RpiB/LacA/LacB family sugar-phosphate isomerase [Bacilli bacterium]|nr:RpiB/LacA/LacB family sugar-phosphate isomerase [Bacilli bacterium]